MKKRYFQKTALLLMIMFASVSCVFAQNNDQEELWLNNNTNDIYKNPSFNNVGIGTSTPQSPLEVKGGILADSMRIKKVLHIGDSSFTFISNVLCSTATLPTDEILSNVGRVAFGFGPSIPTFFSLVNVGVGLCDPKNKIHLHQDAPFVFQPPPRVSAQFTNGGGTTGGTGSLATDGFLVGIGSNGTAILDQQENFPMWLRTTTSPIDLFTNGTEKMRVWHDVGNNPRIGIGPLVTTPLTYLHMGADVFTGSGYRNWMNVGTLYYSTLGTGFQRSDNMYVGLREYSPDRTDAIINWGNNPTTQPNFTDRLRFVFTAATALTTLNASYPDGLEIARMISDGNNGRIGFCGDATSFLTQNPYSNGPDPGSTVEINSPAPNPVPSVVPNTTTGFSTPNPFGGTGFSGLRFTDLTSASIPSPPNNKALSVDINGDVILVPAGAGGFFNCTNTAANLPFDSRFNLNAFNFYFEGQGLPRNSVSIGITCSTPLTAKLDVLQASGSTGTIGSNIKNTDNSGTGSVIGFKSRVTGIGTNCQTIAGWFEADSLGTPQFKNNAAIVVPKDRGFVSIGFASNSSVPACFQSIYGASFDLEIAGALIASNTVFPSDSRYKQNVITINNALKKIARLNGVYFNYDTIGYPNNRFQSGRQVGIIAQNIDTVLHEVVKIDVNGYYSVDYARMVPLLVEGIKQLKQQVDSLQGYASRVNGANNQTVELSSDVILYQNMPNPFGDETVINYYLPDNVTIAKMIFYDETGRVIKEEIIENRGMGSVTLKTASLAAGIYSYSLEVNGKNIQARKMQKTK